MVGGQEYFAGDSRAATEPSKVGAGTPRVVRMARPASGAGGGATFIAEPAAPACPEASGVRGAPMHAGALATEDGAGAAGRAGTGERGAPEVEEPPVPSELTPGQAGRDAGGVALRGGCQVGTVAPCASSPPEGGVTAAAEGAGSCSRARLDGSRI